MRFSEDKLKKVDEIKARYPQGRQKSALIPLLHMAQEDNNGWLSVEAADRVAELLQIKPIEVYEVATFCVVYNLKPVGKYMFEVCHTGPCMLNGGNDIIDSIKQKL